MSKFSLDEINVLDYCKADLVIICCSFESRSIELLKRFETTDKPIVVFYNKESAGLFEENLKYVKSHIKYNYLTEISIDDPLFTVDRIIQTLDKFSSHNIKNVLLDITCFTHEALLIVLKVLSTIFNKVNITCAYVNALDYSIGDNGNDKWLSRGISKIRSVLGYAGNIEPGKKTHLILIVGYEIDRAYAIINELEPNSISIGYGKAEHATAAKNKSSNELYSNLLFTTSALYYDISRFEIRCNDPVSTAYSILEQAKKNQDKNIIVVPLNNKLSTLGAALAYEKNNNLQICYAKALEYNIQNYSLPGDQVYIFSIADLIGSVTQE